MSSNTIVVSYLDLAVKGLIGDLKKAALCDVKTVCRLSCNRCPNVCGSIDLAQISVVGLEIEQIVIKQSEHGDLDLHINADNIMLWLEQHDLAHQKIPDEEAPGDLLHVLGVEQ
ncbi:MAG TPA: hypothetical protein VIS54_05135 [Psychromonas sp.]